MTITYTPSADDVKLVTGASSEVLTLAKDTTLTMTIAGTGTATATAFTPDTLTISNTTLKTSGAADNEVESIVISNLVVDITDPATVTVTTGTPDLSGITLSQDASDIDGSVSATVEYGPAIEQAADKSVSLVEASVEKTY